MYVCTTGRQKYPLFAYLNNFDAMLPPVSLETYDTVKGHNFMRALTKVDWMLHVHT